MKRRRPIRGVLLFCVKFLVIAPVCLALWWGPLIRGYVWALGQISGGLLRGVFGLPIEYMRVVTDPEGILNSETVLAFYEDSAEHLIKIAFMIDSLPPFVILTLATAGLGFRRRLGVILVGTGVMFAGHVAFVSLAYRFRAAIAQSPEIPSALGEFWLTVPFVLWIVLAYWDKVSGLFSLDPRNVSKKKQG